jgi:hypothetical protein
VAAPLTAEEKQWLLAVSRGPLGRLAANKSIPRQVCESLVAQRLVRFRNDVLEITAKGEIVAGMLRSLSL